MKVVFTPESGIGMLSDLPAVILDHPDLPSVYEASRKCVVEHSDGKIEEFKDFFRMTLGFEKMKQLVRSLTVTENDVVLSLFGGPGGTVRMLSLFRPRLIVATDILYPGKLPSFTGWHFAPEILFDNWVEGLERLGVSSAAQLRYPVYIQLDVRVPDAAFDASIDKIVIDPPYGNVSERLLGITPQQSKEIFLAGVILGQRYLRPNGRMSCLCPRPWLEDHLLDETSMKTVNVEVVGKSGRFVLIELVK